MWRRAQWAAAEGNGITVCRCAEGQRGGGREGLWADGIGTIGDGPCGSGMEIGEGLLLDFWTWNIIIMSA